MPGAGDSFEEEVEHGDREAYLQELHKECSQLQKENTLLGVYLQRVAPAAAHTEEDDESKKGQAKRRKSKMEPAKKEEMRGVSLDEKNDIAAAEMELTQATIDKIKSDGEKEVDEINTYLEEIDMRIAETKKDMYEFKRDIIVGAENARTGKTVAEKMLKFMEDRLKAKDSMVEKLQLKNTTYKHQQRKMEGQLHQKEDMGEVLHVVDFDQLKIENRQYLEKIDERNNELLRLKLTTGKAVQVLGDYKTTLNALIEQGKTLRKQIAEKREQLARFESDWNKAMQERAAAERKLRRLKQAQQDMDRPQILDYIKLKAEVHELEKKQSDWERKLEIAEMDAARTRKIYTTMTTMPHPLMASPLVQSQPAA
ncbi:hypothetical protein WJX72_004391 [[Myrmecia] bisecta]|uniref:Cilia- and flagella-associated protein 263 n=1 Tax=[Myrmecia] bisecta TaxID=41462 RepID=A0AAW1R6B5_9CHLO